MGFPIGDVHNPLPTMRYANALRPSVRSLSAQCSVPTSNSTMASHRQFKLVHMFLVVYVCGA